MYVRPYTHIFYMCVYTYFFPFLAIFLFISLHLVVLQYVLFYIPLDNFILCAQCAHDGGSNSEHSASEQICPPG